MWTGSPARGWCQQTRYHRVRLVAEAYNLGFRVYLVRVIAEAAGLVAVHAEVQRLQRCGLLKRVAQQLQHRLRRVPEPCEIQGIGLRPYTLLRFGT